MVLSKNERKVLSLITKKKESVNGIAYRLKTSKRYVYKVIKSLKKKGYLKDESPKETKGGSSPKKSEQKETYRLHNIELKLNVIPLDYRRIRQKIISDERPYDVVVNQQNRNVYITFKNLRYMLTKNGVYLLFPKDFEIRSSDVQSCYKKLEKQIKSILVVFDRHFGTNICKHPKIRDSYYIINQHISHLDDFIGHDLDKTGEVSKLKIKDDYDGKTAYLWDMSKGLLEAESPHPTKARVYMGKYEHMLNMVKRGEFKALVDEYKIMREGVMTLMKQHAEEEALALDIPSEDKPIYIG